MDRIKINATLNPNDNDWKIIDDGIVQYNNQKNGKQKNTPIASFAYFNDKIIGGITGTLFWNYLFIDSMWIQDEYRRRGIGSDLLDKIEKLSLEQGISRCHLYTHSFQSLDFYKKSGFTVVGQLEDMPLGEEAYFL